MFVVWKRPDGFHGASPADYEAVELGDARIWLHKTEKKQFPFRVSGGWESGDATHLLNKIVNSLPHNGLKDFLVKEYEHSMKSDPELFISDLQNWVQELIKNPKGDTWEVEIIVKALRYVGQKLDEVKNAFLKSVPPKD